MLLARKNTPIICIIAIVCLLSFVLVVFDANATVQWSQTYSFGINDRSRALAQTSDGGYIMAGFTQFSNETIHHAMMVKADSSGNLQWNKTIGGTLQSDAFSVLQTNDGGYALAGIMNVSSERFWLLKADSSGNTLWSQTYGGPFNEELYAMTQTSDGGYALAGCTTSFGSGSQPDLWLVKTDANGTAQWSQRYGTLGNDAAYSVVQTSDGGYVMAGQTNTSSCWLVKTDSVGAIQWNSTFGDGISTSTGMSVVPTSDAGYALAVNTNSTASGSYDFMFIKTDASGSMLWNKTYGGSSDDNPRAIVQSAEGGYALTGSTQSFGAGGRDVWVVKTDSSGNMQWNQTIGGTNNDMANAIIRTNDGGYAVAGSTQSYGLTNTAFFLIKMDNTDPSATPSPTATPVPTIPPITPAPTQTPTPTPTLTPSPAPTVSPTPITSTEPTLSPFATTPAPTITVSPSPLPLPSPSSNASNIESTVWVPPPVNAATATIVSIAAVGAVSMSFAAATTSSMPTSGLTNTLTEKIRDLMPESVKKWLEELVASRRKLSVSQKTGSPFKPTKSETITYAIATAILAFSFAYVKVNDLSQILLVLPTIFATSILVGFTKAYITIAYSRTRGVWTEHKLWYFGLAAFIFTTFAFRMPFSSPTRQVHCGPKFTKRLGAILSLASILISLVFAVFFSLLLLGGLTVIGSTGLAMCLIGAFFDTFPIAPMSGKEIVDHSKTLWIILFAATLALYASWLLLI